MIRGAGRLIVTLLFCLVGINTVLAIPAKPQHRNVVVIYLDDLDAHVSKGFMPKVEALVAGQGITFNNAFVTTPQCAPSRASLHTGLLAHNHGVWGVGGGRWKVFKPLLSNSLGVWMQKAGYRTGFYGKLMNEFIAPNGYRVPGWDQYSIYDFVSGGYRYFDYKLFEQRHRPYGQVNQYGESAKDYLTDVLADKTVNFIKAAVADGKPFFVILAPLAPHSPATPAPRDAGYHDTTPFTRSIVFNEADISDKPKPVRDLPLLTEQRINRIVKQYRRKLDSLMAVDDAGERIVKLLASLGVLENTDVIVTSDNGYAFGSHRWQFKQLQYDVTARVPLFWRGPGIPAGQTRDQFVSNVDVTATILARAGVPSPGVLDGESFAAIMNPDGATSEWRSGVVIENIFTDRRLPEPGYCYSAVRTATRMFGEVQGPSYVDRETYDMVSDPYQATNTFPSMRTDKRARWDALLKRLESCRGADCNNF